MELFGANIKKIISKKMFSKISFFGYFLKRKLFLYFWKWIHGLFSPSTKNEKNANGENLLPFRKRKRQKNFSDPRK